MNQRSTESRGVPGVLERTNPNTGRREWCSWVTQTGGASAGRLAGGAAEPQMGGTGQQPPASGRPAGRGRNDGEGQQELVSRSADIGGVSGGTG